MNDLLKKIFSIFNLISLLLDFIGALLLSFYALILGPLGFLRGPLALERGFTYVAVLLPRGLLARSVRVAIDWRMGQFDMAISQAEALIAQIEDHYEQQASAAYKRVLMDFYTCIILKLIEGSHFVMKQLSNLTAVNQDIRQVVVV